MLVGASGGVGEAIGPGLGAGAGGVVGVGTGALDEDNADCSPGCAYMLPAQFWNASNDTKIRHEMPNVTLYGI